MSARLSMRLSTRLALCVAALVPLLVLLVGLLVHHQAARDLRAERDRLLSARSRALTPLAATYALRARLAPALPADRLERRLSAAALEAGDTAGIRIQVTGAAPLVLGSAPAAPPGTARVRDGVPATATLQGRRWRYVTTGLGRSGGSGRLWVFEPTERVDAQVARLRRRVLTATLVAAVAGAAAGFGLGRFAVRPLRLLRRQARAIDLAPGRGRRLRTSSGVTELDELAGILNDLLDRRDAAVTRTGAALETARAFTASAAHELRTPLTSMTTNIDLLARPGLPDADRAEIIADLVAEHRRVLRLITMLRRLADGELIEPDAFTAVDLADVIEAAADDARRRHPQATLTVAAPEALPVRGWAEGLRLVADNLLDNAVIHGAAEPDRAVVEAALGRDGDQAVLVVRDHGPGVPEGERRAVLDRFHRRAGSPGSGLGLALVARQVALHGGTITIGAPSDGPGARVEVRLPASADAVPPPDRGASPAPAGGGVPPRDATAPPDTADPADTARR